MTVAEWLALAKADAEKRGLPDLIPALEGLAKATEQLRAADWNRSASDVHDHDATRSLGVTRAREGSGQAPAMTTIAEIAPKIAAGKITSEKITENCLATIADLNPEAECVHHHHRGRSAGAARVRRTRRSPAADILARCTAFRSRSRT